MSATIPLNNVKDMQLFLDRVSAEVSIPLRSVVRGKSRERACAAPVPLHAQGFLINLARGGFEKAEFIVGNLRSLISKPAQITRAWRAASLSLAPLITVGIGLLIGAMLNFESIRWQRIWANLYPDKPSLRVAAQLYSEAVKLSKKAESNEKELELIRAYVVSHFGEFLTNETFWANREMAEHFPEPQRTLLQEAISSYPAPAPEAVQEAERVVPKSIRKREEAARLASAWVFLGMLICGAAAVSLVEFFGCLIFRQSPILRLFGIAVVDRQGQPANRLRLLWRWVVVWVPTGLMGFMTAGFGSLSLAIRMSTEPINPSFTRALSIVALVMMFVAGTMLLGSIIYATLHPDKGLQDRFAGARLVPT